MHILKRIARASVWAKEGVKPEDYRYRGQFRVCFPIIDMLFFYFGVVGWNNGVASVEEAASSSWQTWWSACIAVVALAAFVGVAFPRLWPVELVAKLLLISLVSMYVVLYLLRGTLDPNVTATAGLICMLVVFPIWRLGDLAVIAIRSFRTPDGGTP